MITRREHDLQCKLKEEKIPLPVLIDFKAPLDQIKSDQFFAAFKAYEWDWKKAIMPYKDERLAYYNLLQNKATGEFSYCLRPNSIHREGLRIRFGYMDIEDDFNSLLNSILPIQ